MIYLLQDFFGDNHARQSANILWICRVLLLPTTRCCHCRQTIGEFVIFFVLLLHVNVRIILAADFHLARKQYGVIWLHFCVLSRELRQRSTLFQYTDLMTPESICQNVFLPTDATEK